MMNRVLITYIILDLLFLGTGVLLISASITQNDSWNPPTATNVARKMVLKLCPLLGALVNGIFIVFTFLLSLPGLALPASRLWLWLHGWLVAFCTVFTLALGLDVWLRTLKTRSNLGVLWAQQPAQIRGLLEETFKCCGYVNSSSPRFQPNSVCPDSAKAALMPDCVSSFANFANRYLSMIFTVSFGVVALDVFLLLGIAMVLKQRREQKRYRIIDEKNGLGSI